jgi:hypothetical protein
MILYRVLLVWILFQPTWSLFVVFLLSVLFSSCALSFVFIFSLCVSLLRCKVLASIMAESSCCFQTCEKLSAQAIGYTSLYPL